MQDSDIGVSLILVYKPAKLYLRTHIKIRYCRVLILTRLRFNEDHAPGGVVYDEFLSLKHGLCWKNSAHVHPKVRYRTIFSSETLDICQKTDPALDFYPLYG